MINERIKHMFTVCSDVFDGKEISPLKGTSLSTQGYLGGYRIYKEGSVVGYIQWYATGSYGIGVFGVYDINFNKIGATRSDTLSCELVRNELEQFFA